MPDPERLLTTLYRAAEAVRRTPGRRGRVIDLTGCTEIVVVGDLHGHLGNFQSAHRLADLAKHPTRHLVFQELIHGKTRYPQGGDKSHQALDVFSALKCQFPDRVHMLMGNHEMAQWTNRPIMKNDESLNALFLQGVQEAYGASNDKIVGAYFRLFAVLPLAIRTANRIMISHSLPRSKHLARFELRHLETDAFPAEDLTVGGPVYELLWGRETHADHVQSFLRKVDCDWLISGHIQCDAGFARPNEQQLIVDCCSHPAACALLPTDRRLSDDDWQKAVRML